MGRTLATALRRFMVRTGDGPLRPLWALAHTALRLGVGAVLLRGLAGATCRTRGSFATGDVRYGLSDLDLEVVVPDAEGAGRALVRRRWARLTSVLPPLAGLIDLAVYERSELAAARSMATLRSDRPLHLVPRPAADEADLRLRPGLGGSSDPVARREAAWLELQFAWRWVLGACAGAPGADRAYLCVKLVSDPARIWLWLAHGEHPGSRREVLERARLHLPAEADAIDRALALHAALAREPAADLRDFLPACVRISALIADRVTEESLAAGTTEVRLVGAGSPLALRADHSDGLRRLTGGDPDLLPLADWRARAWPQYPDDAFALTGLDPRDPAAVGAAVAAAGDLGPFPAMQHDGLIVLPGPGLMRAVQCAATDPVSFALARGQTVARFPEVPGLCAADCAQRALLEHQVWLGAWRDEGAPVFAAWMEAQDRTSAGEIQILGWLFSAARAALFHASVQAGEPALALTMADAARELGAEEAWEAYAACRRAHADPDRAVVARVRELVLALPEYAFGPA